MILQISIVTPLVNLLELQLHLPGLNQSEFLNGSEERNRKPMSFMNTVICLFHQSWNAETTVNFIPLAFLHFILPVLEKSFATLL